MHTDTHLDDINCPNNPDGHVYAMVDSGAYRCIYCSTTVSYDDMSKSWS